MSRKHDFSLGPEEEESSIDLTPMLDVVFIMLMLVSIPVARFVFGNCHITKANRKKSHSSNQCNNFFHFDSPYVKYTQGTAWDRIVVI